MLAGAFSIGSIASRELTSIPIPLICGLLRIVLFKLDRCGGPLKRSFGLLLLLLILYSH
jgi:hypothetical protein